jgi:ornithine cyclodeaminase/alanine dehydrogenase-like protein (mu-crystallin family)
LTLLLSEADVEGLLDMQGVVSALEEAFRREAVGEAVNSPRTRSRGLRSVLSVMHAVLPYLGRGGLKSYMGSPGGTRFVIVLYDSADSTPLAVMGADTLGRLRTGGASGVATRHLYRRSSATLALLGSGKQALTQVLGVAAVTSLDGVRVWSPQASHREELVGRLRARGVPARAFDSPGKAVRGADIASTITPSVDPFLEASMTKDLSHLNLCGGNDPAHAEITPDAVASFDTVAVDDLPQAKLEYGDLLLAAKEGKFRWEKAVELCRVVAGQVPPGGKTMFKSGGVALEDVAVASLAYDRALKSGRPYVSVELVPEP